MTSRRCPPEKKATAKQAPSGKGAESVSQSESMARFRTLAKKVVSAGRAEVQREERRQKALKASDD